MNLQLSEPDRGDTADRVCRQLLKAAQEAKRVLLTGPVDPDGDSIGACLALARAMRAVSSARVDVAGTASYRYAWMPDADAMVPDAQVAPDYDLVVVLDGDRRRLEPPVEAAFARAKVRGIIDHHRSTEADGYEICWIDKGAASTTAMIRHLLDAWSLPLDPQLATLLYVGLIFDTGGFRHSNTTPATHALAAELLATGFDHNDASVRVLVERRPQGVQLLGEVLRAARFLADGHAVMGVASQALARSTGAGAGDLEGLVDGLLYTRGVELACLVIEKPDGKVKLSLRSRRHVDVSVLARSLAQGGGGHARAAGVVIPEPLDQVLDRLPAALLAALDGAESTAKS